MCHKYSIQTSDSLHEFCCHSLSGSFQLPVLEGHPNVTTLDLQMKNLRDAAIDSIKQMANHVREEATDVKDTVSNIEDWLDRIKQLAEEVRKKIHYCMFTCSPTQSKPPANTQCYVGQEHLKIPLNI